MGVFDLTTPDGAKYRIDAPDEGAALGALQTMLGESTAPTAPSQAPEGGVLDVAKQVPVGFNEALATGAGFPVDATTWLLNQIPGVNIEEPFGGSGSIKRGMGLIGANPDATPATTPAEHIARGTGGGIASVVAPGMVLTGLGRLGALSPRLMEIGERIFGSSASVPAAAKNMTIGATGGAGSVAAEQAAPEPYKPIASFGGGLAGGILGAVGAEAPAAVATGARKVGQLVEPFTQGGREVLAARTLADSATNPKAVKARLNEGVDEIVPGSRPTTFQATGDMGLGRLEREAATRDPTAFLSRQAEQNTARTAALDSIQPTGSPADVSAFFRAQLQSLDDSTQRALDEATGRAQAAASGIGGQGSPEAAGQAILARLEPPRRSLEIAAQDSAAGIGGREQPQAYGETMRAALADANALAKKRENHLWRAVDPDGTLALDVSPLRQAAADLIRSIPRTARPIEGEEAAILETIARLGPAVPFADANALRSRISDAMRQARIGGDMQAVSRLTSLREGLETGISDTIERRVAQEAEAVARGEMAAENTLTARMGEWRLDAQASQQEARSLGVAGSPAGAGTQAFRSPSLSGAASEARIGPGGPARDQGLPGDVGSGRVAAPSGTSSTPAGAAGSGDMGFPADGRRASAPFGVHGETSGTGVGPYNDGGPPGLPGNAGREAGRVPSAGRSVTPSPSTAPDRLSQEGLQANFDEAARERLGRATEATRERKRLFHEGPIGQALRTLGYRDNYAISEASVPGLFFQPGDKGAHAVAVFRRAVQDDQQALDALQNYAAMSLRRAAERPDGTLDPQAFQRWAKSHGPALASFPGFKERFATAARASEALQNFRPFRADLSPGVIPEQFFRSGPGGFDSVQQLRGMIGDDPATTILSDYAAGRLRTIATRPDGTIDPGKYATWRRSHADALRALPDLERRFKTAADATEAVAQAAARRREALDTYQAGAIGRLIGVDDPHDIVRHVGSIFGRSDSVAIMNRLAAEASKDPAAKEGLRKAVADYIMGRFISNTEAGTSGTNSLKSDQLLGFVTQNEATLKRVLDPAAVGLLRRVAVDLRQANRSVASTKLPGGSNTPQDIIKELRRTGDAPLLRVLLGAVFGGTGLAAGGPWGAIAGALGSHVVSSMRVAGLQKVDDLLVQAMLNPDVARALFNRVPNKPGEASTMVLRQALNRASMFAAAGAGSESESEGAPPAAWTNR